MTELSNQPKHLSLACTWSIFCLFVCFVTHWTVLQQTLSCHLTNAALNKWCLSFLCSEQTVKISCSICYFSDCQNIYNYLFNCLTGVSLREWYKWLTTEEISGLFHLYLPVIFPCKWPCFSRETLFMTEFTRFLCTVYSNVFDVNISSTS